VRQGEELTFAYFGSQDIDEEEEAEEVDEHGQIKVKVVCSSPGMFTVGRHL
jgi:hypothetical protein